MKHLLACATVAVAVAAGSASSLVRAAPAPALAAVFSTRGPIVRPLAADGHRVAAVTRLEGGCGRIVVWSAPGPASFRRYPVGCSADGVGEIALGNGRVAWIEEGGGNSLELVLTAARLAGGPPRQLEYAANGDRAGGDPVGGWIGGLVGSGSLLAYNSWRVACSHLADDGGYCDRWTEIGKLLLRIAGGHRVAIKRGDGGYFLGAAGAGRLAVQSAGTVTVLAAGGTRLATVPAVNGDPPRAIALDGKRLAVQRASRLDLYAPSTGGRLRSLALGPAAPLRLSGINSRLALLRGSHRLVLVRATDGRRVSFALPTGAAATLVDARLTGAGLFYAYNTPGESARGRIVFVREAALLARFR